MVLALVFGALHYADERAQNSKMKEAMMFVVEKADRMDLDLKVKSMTMGKRILPLRKEAGTFSPNTYSKSFVVFSAPLAELLARNIRAIDYYSMLVSRDSTVGAQKMLIIIRTTDRLYAKKISKDVLHGQSYLCERDVSSMFLKTCPDSLMICMVISNRGECVFSYVVDADDFSKDLLCARIVMSILGAEKRF